MFAQMKRKNASVYDSSSFCEAIRDGMESEKKSDSATTTFASAFPAAGSAFVASLERLSSEVSECFGKPIRFYIEDAACGGSVHLNCEKKKSFWSGRRERYLGMISLSLPVGVGGGTISRDRVVVEFDNSFRFEDALKSFLRLPEIGKLMRNVIYGG